VNINDATPLTLTDGQERGSVDIVARLVSTVTLSGHVTRADGGSLQNVPLMLIMSTSGVTEGGATMMTRPVVNGEFVFPDLEPGQYQIRAQARVTSDGRTSDSNVTGLSALADVTLGSEGVTNLNLVLDAGLTVTGHVTFDGLNAPPADAGRVIVRLQPPSVSAGSLALVGGAATADGTFTLPGVQPGPYVLTATISATPAARTWTLQSATMAGHDVLDTPFEIRAGSSPPPIEVHFTNRVTTLTGLFSDQSGRPISDYSLIVFPTNPDRWLQNSRWMRAPSRPSSDGRFEFTGLPPGEYYLAAITTYDPQEWYTRPFLESVLPGAIKITLTDGQTTTQDLKVR
jgi:hypothetical protein